ncbi:conjugal transfer protein TrbL [Nocardia cyriacigeorgica]|uniref:conjugal transfer protein TrbL n=1 Tax=Nocardia cyriacigeorgica TaxID=135487 RepID=UPI002454B266|nr:conjugal transfer protein TrbL [Nocardia cyriacigeorgica]
MGVCDVPVISTVCDVAGEAAATVVAAPFDWLAQAMGGAAGWLIEAMWAVFDTTTLVDVQTDGFTSVYNLIFGIGVFLVLIFFCLQLITGLIRRDPTALSRAALGAAKSVLGAFVVVTLTALALEIVDQLSIGIIQTSGETTETMGDKIILLAAGLSGNNTPAPGVGAIVTIFLAGLMIAAVAIVWFSLLIRKALLLVGVVLAPIAFAGASWDATKGWIGKWAAFVIALIISKLVLVVIFLLAITQIATPIELDIAAVTEPITGIVLMGIAAFAPYMVYRFVSFVGFDLYQQMGTEQEAKNALNRPVPIPSKPQGGGEPKKVLEDPNDGASDAGSGGTPPPSPAPAQAPAAAGGETVGAEAGASAAGAGPAAAVVVGAKVAKDAAEAGPKAGHAVAGQAETAADAAGGQNGGTPPPSQTPPPSTPQPRTPTEPSNPTASPWGKE